MAGDSARYMSGEAWLKSCIADAWAQAHAEREEWPGYYDTENLFILWSDIAGNALCDEVVH